MDNMVIVRKKESRWKDAVVKNLMFEMSLGWKKFWSSNEEETYFNNDS